MTQSNQLSSVLSRGEIFSQAVKPGLINQTVTLTHSDLMRFHSTALSPQIIPSSGGKGGSVGSWIIPTSFPPRTEQMKRMTMPNRLPPGKHSLPVMDQTTPNRRANRHTARAHTRTQRLTRPVTKQIFEIKSSLKLKLTKLGFFKSCFADYFKAKKQSHLPLVI